MLSLEKSKEILKSLSNILKILAYLAFAIGAVYFFLSFIVSAEFIIIGILAFVAGLIIFYLSYGLSQEEKWAWVVGLIIFGSNALFSVALLILFRRDIIHLGDFLFSLLFFILLFLSSSVFRKKIEPPALWFKKKGFLIVIIPVIIIYLLAVGLIAGNIWSVRQKEIKTQRYIDKKEELKKIKIISNRMPDSKEFVEQNTKDWKTYQSDKIEISFKYPSDWVKLPGINTGQPLAGECEDVAMDNTPIDFTLGHEVQEKGCIIRIGKDPEIITIAEKANYYTGGEKLLFDQVVEAYEEFLKNSKFRRDFRKEYITVGKISGIRMSDIYQIGDLARIESSVFLPGEDYSIYEISTSFYAQKQEEYLPLFNLMLSTIEFSPNVFAKDTTPPEISKIVFKDSATSTTITWETNEPATSRIIYGIYKEDPYSFDIPPYEFSVPEDSRLTYRHSMTTFGLTKGTTYHFKIISRDKYGNSASSNDIISFPF